MRTALGLGRTCLRQALSRSSQHVSHQCPRLFTTSSSAAPSRLHLRLARPPFFRRPPRPGGKTLLLAALSPAAFVGLAEEDNGDGKTGEEHMLEASRAELAQAVPKALQGSKRVRRGLYFFIEDWVIEPIATGLRFLHLVVIFVPVILAVPVIWFGRRVPERDGERSGTLWWYGFLVSSMERAGAAFIKVGVGVYQ